MTLQECFAVQHSVRGIVAILSAILIWLGTILSVLQILELTGGSPRPDFNSDTSKNFRKLDVPTLKLFWKYRSDQLPVDFFINVFISAGLMCLAYCVIILKRVFRRYRGGKSDIPNFMAGCFFLGAALPSLAILQLLGYTSAADYTSQWENLPDSGLQALHISYITAQGGSIYLWSTEFLLIPIGLFLCSLLAISTGDLSRRHAIWGIVTGVVGLLTFVMEVTAFNVSSPGVSITLAIVYLGYGVILLPVWTLWLGVILRRIKHDEIRDKDADTNLVAMQNA